MRKIPFRDSFLTTKPTTCVDQIDGGGLNATRRRYSRLPDHSRDQVTTDGSKAATLRDIALMHLRVKTVIGSDLAILVTRLAYSAEDILARG